MLDPELRQRAPNLRQRTRIYLLARLGRVEIVTAAVGVEAQRKPVFGENVGQATERRERPFFLDQKARVDLAGCIIKRDDQIEPRSQNSVSSNDANRPDAASSRRAACVAVCAG